MIYMGVRLKTKGDLAPTKKFLNKIVNWHNRHIFEMYGQVGVEALQAATPKRTGKTAASWRYEIVEDGDRVTLFWTNDNRTSQGDLIAILLQYGHGTGTGGYVQGRDYINPAIEPVFDAIADSLWKVITES